MRSLSKLVLLAGAVYGGYCLYKKYIDQPKDEQEFDDVDNTELDYDGDAQKEEDFVDRIKAAVSK